MNGLNLDAKQAAELAQLRDQLRKGQLGPAGQDRLEVILRAAGWENSPGSMEEIVGPPATQLPTKDATPPTDREAAEALLLAMAQHADDPAAVKAIAALGKDAGALRRAAGG